MLQVKLTTLAACMPKTYPAFSLTFHKNNCASMDSGHNLYLKKTYLNL